MILNSEYLFFWGGGFWQQKNCEVFVMKLPTDIFGTWQVLLEVQRGSINENARMSHLPIFWRVYEEEGLGKFSRFPMISSWSPLLIVNVKSLSLIKRGVQWGVCFWECRETALTWEQSNTVKVNLKLFIYNVSITRSCVDHAEDFKCYSRGDVNNY